MGWRPRRWQSQPGHKPRSKPQSLTARLLYSGCGAVVFVLVGAACGGAHGCRMQHRIGNSRLSWSADGKAATQSDIARGIFAKSVCPPAILGAKLFGLASVCAG